MSGAHRSPVALGRRAVAALVGVGTVASSLTGALINAAPADAAAAPGQDVLNDWGRTVDEVNQEVNLVVDANAGVIAARTRYITALTNYGNAKQAESTARAAYVSVRAARVSPTTKARALSTYTIASRRSYTAAGEVVASQLAMSHLVDAVTAGVRAQHYSQAPAVTPPTTPTGLTATGATDQVALSWNAVDGATGYRVLRDGFEIASTTNLSWLDTGLVNGNAYGYRVFATNIAGWSPISDEVVGIPTISAPPAPTGLMATPGDTTMALSWTAEPSATSYEVYRGASLLGTVTGTTYLDTALVDGTPYTWTVKAVNGGVPSNASSPVTSTPVATPPTSPTNVVATPGNASVSLVWTAPSGATSYSVLRGGITVASGLTGTSWTDSTVTNGQAYTYSVLAYRANSPASAPSATASATPVAPPLPTPSGLSATAGDTQVSLTWTPVSGATSYDVYRGGTKLTTVATSSYTNTGLTDGTTYSYYVIATNTTQTSAASATVTAKPMPAAPTGVTGTGGDLKATISWTAVSGASSYNVYRGGAKVGSVTAPTTTYVDSAVSNNVAYAYTVTAVKSGAESVASSSVSVTPTVITPGIPTGLVATAGDAQVTLSWTASANAQTYKVYRGTTLLVTQTGTSYVDLSLANNTTYSYTVVAVNGSASSAASTAASATPQAAPLSTPIGLSAAPGSNTVSLSWTAVTGATSYDIYRGGTLLTTVATASYSDNGVTNGQNYSYYVIAKNATQTSAASATVTATPQQAATGAPTGLAGVAGDQSASLTWTAVSGATSYNVYRNGTKITPTSIAPTSFSEIGLTNGQAYTYYVTALVGGVESAASTTISVTPFVITPSAPTGLSATAGNAQVVLGWTASANAQSYKIFRNGTQIGTSATTSYTDLTAANGTTYTYTVAAVNGSATSTQSSGVSATPVAPPLPTPTGLSATAGDTQISLSWSAVTGATSYDVYRNGTKLTTVATTSYTNTGLADGTSYSYYVIATNTTQTSTASVTVSATPMPAAPTGLSGSGGDLTASLTWTAVSGATSYNVYRGGVKIGSSATTTYVDTTVSNNVAYAYTVTAIKNSAESVASATVNVTPFVLTPAVPTGLTTTAGNGQVALSWTAAANAKSYKVYRGATLVASPTGTSYTDTGLPNGVAVTYTVVAVNGSASSAASAAVSATPMAPAPGAPTGLVATAGNASVALSWTAVATATSYKVYRDGVSIATVTTGTTYTDATAVNGTTYSYTVTAIATTTEGAASLAATATPSKPLVNGTFTGSIVAIASGHGTIQVVITVVNSVMTVSKGTLLTNDSTETVNINKTAIPQYDTKAVAAKGTTFTKVSGATLTFAAYKTSLQAAMTAAGI